MYFQTLSHAGLRVVAAGKELVCDPWLVGSTYWRSWWNYPPVPEDLIATLKPDFIYLTHLHWDHFQSVSLRRFDPDTQVLVPYDRYDRIVRDLGHVGMKNVRQLRHGERVQLGRDFALTSYHFAPFITDSAIVVEADGATIFNANDAKLAGAPLKQVLRRHPHFDFCLRSHSSANPRACYHTTDAEGVTNFEDDNEHYLRSFSLFMAAVKPRFAVPFASNSCLLHDDVYAMNHLVQTPQAVANYFKEFASKRGLNTEIAMMMPGDLWDSVAGFRIQPNDWFDDRPSKLDAYRKRVMPTLQRQASKEARTAVSLQTVQRFFRQFRKNVPSMLTRSLRGTEVLIATRSADRPVGFAVDLHRGGRVRQIAPKEFHTFDKRIDCPAVILRQAMAMNMFQHAGISKRVHYHATRSAMPQLKWFVALLEIAEAEVFPLRRNLNMRTVKALLPRWREGLLYTRVLLDVLRGRGLPDLEEKYLQEMAV